MTDHIDRQIAAMQEFIGLNEQLGKDILLNQYFHDSAITFEMQQFYRRALVRSVFAMIEGVIYRSKQFILVLHGPHNQIFDQGELNILTETSYKLQDNGAVTEEPIKVNLASNIKFTFTAVRRATGVEHQLQLGIEWQKLKKAIKVRDRMMHPKTMKDLIIDNQEYEDILLAWSWFNQNIYAVFGIDTKSIVSPQIVPE